MINIFRAVTEDGKNIPTYNADRKKDYFCPHCKKTVRLKAGAKVVRHFYHLAKCDCQYSNESMDHIKMKEQVMKFFQGYQMEIETQAIPSRRADILLHAEGKRIAVECQVSPITIEELKRRTKDYNRNGIYVLWIFHIKRTKISKDELSHFFDNNTFDDFIKMPDEKRLPAELIEAHYYFDTVYVMDYEGRFLGLNLHPVERTTIFNGVEHTKVLERTKQISLFITSPSVQFIKSNWLTELFLIELGGNMERGVRSSWRELQVYCKECDDYHRYTGRWWDCFHHREEKETS